MALNSLLVSVVYQKLMNSNTPLTYAFMRVILCTKGMCVFCEGENGMRLLVIAVLCLLVLVACSKAPVVEEPQEYDVTSTEGKFIWSLNQHCGPPSKNSSVCVVVFPMVGETDDVNTPSETYVTGFRIDSVNPPRGVVQILTNERNSLLSRKEISIHDFALMYHEYGTYFLGRRENESNPVVDPAVFEPPPIDI